MSADVTKPLDDLLAQLRVDIAALETRIQTVEVQVAAIVTLSMPDDVKAAFNVFTDWVKANV